MFVSSVLLMENGVVLRATEGEGHGEVFGDEEVGEAVVSFGLVDVVRAASRVLNALMFDAAVVLDLRDGEPGLFRYRGEAYEEGAGGFGVEAFLRFVRGQFAVEPGFLEDGEDGGDEIGLVSVYIGEVAQNATVGGQLDAKFGRRRSALCRQQKLQALEALHDLICRWLIKQRQIEGLDTEVCDHRIGERGPRRFGEGRPMLHPELTRPINLHRHVHQNSIELLRNSIE